MAACAGKDVVVFEVAERLMGRAVSAPIAEYFHDLHTAAGVQVRLSSTVSSVQRVVDRLELHDGHSSVAADVVVAGVGVVPNDELAAQAGLATNDGVVVDAQLRTTDPHISAIGDCARFPARRGQAVGDSAGIGAERQRPRTPRRGVARRRTSAVRMTSFHGFGPNSTAASSKWPV